MGKKVAQYKKLIGLRRDFHCRRAIKKKVLISQMPSFRTQRKEWSVRRERVTGH